MITATAQDDVGVVRVELCVDGVLKCSDVTVPYTCAWSLPQSKGKRNYRMTARAFDAAGNLGNSPTVTVTVK